MSLPYEKLTPILGDAATEYIPESETTPEFMNGKFAELLLNDKNLDNKINDLSNDTKGVGFGKDVVNLGENIDLKGFTKNFRGVVTTCINFPPSNPAYSTSAFLNVKYYNADWQEITFVSFHDGVLWKVFKKGGVWQPWQQIATTTKTSFSCSAKTGYTIVSQNCYTLNGMAYINIAIKKVDGSVFDSVQHALFISPYYSTSLHYPINAVFTNGPLVGGFAYNGAIWTDGGCYITLTGNTATQINIRAEVPL